MPGLVSLLISTLTYSAFVVKSPLTEVACTCAFGTDVFYLFSFTSDFAAENRLVVTEAAYMCAFFVFFYLLFFYFFIFAPVRQIEVVLGPFLVSRRDWLLPLKVLCFTILYYRLFISL